MFFVVWLLFFVEYNSSKNITVTKINYTDHRKSVKVTYEDAGSLVEYFVTNVGKPEIYVTNSTRIHQEFISDKSKITKDEQLFGFFMSEIIDLPLEGNEIILHPEGMKWNLNYDNCESGFNTCYLNLSTDGFSILLVINEESSVEYPNLQLSYNKLGVKIIADNYVSPFEKSHLIFKFVTKWKKSCNVELSQLRQVIDSQIPGVFYMNRVLCERDPYVDQIFMKWPSIYLSSKTAGKNGNLVHVNSLNGVNLTNLPQEGPEDTKRMVLTVPLTSGEPYQTTGFAAWHFSITVGNDVPESMIPLYIVFSVVFSLPLLALGGHVLFGFFRRKNNDYSPLNE